MIELTKKQVKKTFKVKSDRTLVKMMTYGGFPLPFLRDGVEYWSKEEALKAYGIEEDINEPFINLTEASQILGIDPAITQSYAQKGDIPSYRLFKSKGYKYLFRKSEIEAIVLEGIEENYDFYNKRQRLNVIERMLEGIITSQVLNDLLNPIQRQALTKYVLEGKDLTDIAKELNRTPERIRQLLVKATQIAQKDFPEKLRKLQEYPLLLGMEKEKVKELELALKDSNQQLIDKGIIEKIPEWDGLDVKTIDIRDTDFSVRVKNCLAIADIWTLGDLSRKTEADLAKIRNFGATCIEEVKRVLPEYGLELRQAD